MERANQVLVIDDDEAAREILVELLGRVGYHAFAAPDGRSGLEWLAGAAVPPQAVLLDLRMPGIDGFEVLRRYRAQGGLAPVIALSAMDDKESVVKAMRLGASDYLVKPIEPEELREAIERCSASAPAPAAEEVPAVAPSRPDPVPAILVREARAPPPVAPMAGSRRGPPADFISVSHAMMGIWDMVDRVAETDVPVLIRGESGVGKEGIARALQAKLLQVLQDEEYYRVGGKRPLRADVRVVVATNRVLEEELARGNFREDLYYRLNVVSVHVPPLRDRKEDVPHLIEHFRRKYGSKYKQGAMELSPDVIRRLLEYDYPGNVRELENLVRRLVVLRDERFVLDELKATQARRPALQPALQMGSAGGALPPANQGQQRFEAPPSHPPPPAVPTMRVSAETVSLKEIARQAALRAEREAISAMLARTNWNKRKAAARLQISYKALLYKIKDCGLTDPRITAGIQDLPSVGLAANDLSRSSS